MPCLHAPQTFLQPSTNLFLKLFLYINHLPMSLVHSLVIPLHLALWLQQQAQSGSGLSNEGLISFSLVWVGFEPSALTPLPTVSSHKGGARCLPTFLWCACSWSVSSSWVLFRVWNYLRRLLANASGTLVLLLCLYASICVYVCKQVCVLAVSCPRQEAACPKVIYLNIFFFTKKVWDQRCFHSYD